MVESLSPSQQPKTTITFDDLVEGKCVSDPLYNPNLMKYYRMTTSNVSSSWVTKKVQHHQGILECDNKVVSLKTYLRMKYLTFGKTVAE